MKKYEKWQSKYRSFLLTPIYQASGYQRRLNNLSSHKNRTVCHSDKWFQTEWEESGMNQLPDAVKDKYNIRFGGYIPDCINTFYRYAIEVDGTSHATDQQKAIDVLKDKFYREQGYQVFRIKPYGYNQLHQLKETIREIRNAKPIPENILKVKPIKKKNVWDFSK